jgi:hypothetical protein
VSNVPRCDNFFTCKSEQYTYVCDDFVVANLSIVPRAIDFLLANASNVSRSVMFFTYKSEHFLRSVMFFYW